MTARERENIIKTLAHDAIRYGIDSLEERLEDYDDTEFRFLIAYINYLTALRIHHWKEQDLINEKGEIEW